MREKQMTIGGNNWSNLRALTFAATKNNCIFFTLLFLSFLFGRYPLVRTLAILVLIFLSGRVVIDLLFRDDNSREEISNETRDVFALAAGPAVVFILTCLLKAIGAYGLHPMLFGLCVIVFLGFICEKGFRAYILYADKPFGTLSRSYLCFVLLLLLIYTIKNYPYIHSSAVYITQGFDLFFDKNASEWPYFGEIFAMPMMYVTHVIGATFALISSGDSFQYYYIGQSLVNALFAPIIPIISFIFFRRYLLFLPSAALSLAFCWSVLGHKIYSIRGESIGWLFGFSFLLGLGCLIAQLGKVKYSLAVKLAAFLSVIYFAMALTHGVSAMVTTYLSIGLLVYFIAINFRSFSFKKIFLLLSVFIAGMSLLLGLYLLAFSENKDNDKLIFNYEYPPVAGEQDAAILFERSLLNPTDKQMKGSVTPKVKATPPYINNFEIAKMTALLPVVIPPSKGFVNVGLLHFPNRALANINSITIVRKALYCLGLLFCLYFMFVINPSARHKHVIAIFWSFVVAYIFIVAFAVYLNCNSVSVFPLASIRRTFVYIRFFYWSAIAICIYSIITCWYYKHIISEYLTLSTLNINLNRELIFAFLIMCTFSVSSGFGAYKPPVTISNIIQLDWSVYSSIQSDANPDGSLHQAIEYVEQNTSPNDWVFLNVLSDNQFWYLSSGRYSLLEGSAMYQVYHLQKRAADHINLFRKFALTSDLSLLDGYNVRYFIIAKHHIKALFGEVVPTDFKAFNDNQALIKVLENADFYVFKIK
jgi:hypothetical protein